MLKNMLSGICRNRRFALALLLCTLPLLAQRGGQNASLAENFRFRFMGPAVGNRISAAAGIPGDPTTYYVGAASGGVWKSTDGGARWTPIFDDQPVHSDRRAGGGCPRIQRSSGPERAKPGPSATST